MIRLMAVAAVLTSFLSSVAFAQSCSCLPPSTMIGPSCVAPTNPSNACDDGSILGTPSVVSESAVGATAAAKFQGIINKKLACCLNPYDPLNPGAPLKYDCVDNTLATGGTFDDLWTGSDPNDSGAQPYAIVLATGGNVSVSAKAVSGFYTMAGARCDAFSEFGGTIKSAKINGGQISGQGEQAGSGAACEIVPGAYTVTPPNSLMTAVNTAGKTLPWDGLMTTDCKQAMNMRRCPILVRAAIVTSCAKNPIAPVAAKSYLDALGVTHCLAASVVRIFIHIEQIYEIAGMPRMATIDTLRDQNGVNALSIANLIQNKVGTVCPPGTKQANGTCMGCPANCGGPRCTACPNPLISFAGEITCHN
jgi:hypothetical protein